VDTLSALPPPSRKGKEEVPMTTAVDVRTPVATGNAQQVGKEHPLGDLVECGYWNYQRMDLRAEWVL
jgi:hypothetical protein